MPVDVMLTETDQEALQRWVQRTGIGTSVTDVEPLTGGSQNIVVRLRIDGQPMDLLDDKHSQLYLKYRARLHRLQGK